jgi:hypothetical protein
MKILFTKAHLEGWALVAEIGGALAVIMSVIYLGRQINDNTKLLRSQAHYNALSLAQRPLEMMVENESLAGAVTEYDANPNGVVATTWERCANYYFMQFNSREYMYSQNRDRSIPQQLWVGADAISRRSCKRSQATCAFGVKWRRPSTNPSGLTPLKSFDDDEPSQSASPDDQRSEVEDQRSKIYFRRASRMVLVPSVFCKQCARFPASITRRHFFRSRAISSRHL